MIRKRIFFIAILIILILFSVVVFDQIKVGHDNPDNNTTTVTHEIIGNDSTGSVEVIRNMGNPDGQKRAYVVGVHPLENDTHKTFLKIFQTMKDLNCCYDVYIINVSEDFSQYGQLLPDDQPGRQTGQDLALKYVYPEILKGNYRLAIDVHSNIGAYDFKTFVFSPLKEGLGTEYANEVARNCPDIASYSPDSTTSGPYLTIPLNENGIPAFYFEEYSFASQDDKDQHINELIWAVDGLDLS